MTLTFGSAFTGIGGLDLGLVWAGFAPPLWQIEIDEWCRGLLEVRFPGVRRYGDVHDVDASELAPVDLITGGFPCQPISNAGRRLAQDDPRWLWPEMARLVRGLRPRYVLVENVAALLYRGFDDVQADLAALGYDTEWDCIPASAVGAPHERDRVWLLAYTPSSGRGSPGRAGSGEAQSGRALGVAARSGDVAHAAPAAPVRPRRRRRAARSTRHSSSGSWDSPSGGPTTRPRQRGRPAARPNGRGKDRRA